MKALSAALAICLALFITPSQAEFTDAEKAEAMKLYNARTSIVDAMIDVGNAIREGADDRFLWGSYAQRLDYANSVWCSIGQANLQGVQSVQGFFEGDGRPDTLDSAQVLIDGCLSRIIQLRDTFSLITNVHFESATAELNFAIDQIEAFDWSLPYASPFSEDHPRIVGPHGHKEAAMNTLFRAENYAQRSYRHGTDFYMNAPTWPTEINPQGFVDADHNFAEMTANYGFMIKRLFTTNFLHASVEPPAEAAIIAQMVIDGSGLRGPTFMRLLLMDEYILGARKGSVFDNWQGRPTLNGVSGASQLFINHFDEMVEEVSRVAPADFMVAQLSQEGFAGYEGYAFRFRRQIGDWWTDFDKWSTFSTQFFFEIPAPPMGAVCGAGTTLDQSVTPPECVADAPATLVCGTGTEIDNSTSPPSCVSTVICPPFPLVNVLHVDSVVADDVNGTVQFSCRP